MMWQGSIGVDEEFRDGRRGAGAENHCAHGAYSVVEHILDWQPFDYISMDHTIDAPGNEALIVTFVFSDAPGGGTHIETRWAEPAPEKRDYFNATRPMLQQSFGQSFAALRKTIAEHPGNAAAVGEPLLPHSSERFLTEPVLSSPH